MFGGEKVFLESNQRSNYRSVQERFAFSPDMWGEANEKLKGDRGFACWGNSQGQEKNEICYAKYDDD
jgi:hypothetical protein